MNQLDIIEIYTIITQQQNTNSIQVTIDYKLGDTGSTCIFLKTPRLVSCEAGFEKHLDQPWDFFGRNDAKAETPVLWPPHAKS